MTTPQIIAAIARQLADTKKPKRTRAQNDWPVTPKENLKAVVDKIIGSGNGLNLSDCGLTDIDTQWWATAWQGWDAQKQYGFLDLTKNNFDLEQLENLLTNLDDWFGGILPPDGARLSCEDGSMPTPAAAWCAGWDYAVNQDDNAISFNCGNGIATLRVNGPQDADYSDCSISKDDAAALISFLLTNYDDLAWHLDISGSGPPEDNTLKKIDELEENGWDIDHD